MHIEIKSSRQEQVAVAIFQFPLTLNNIWKSFYWKTKLRGNNQVVYQELQKLIIYFHPWLTG